MSFRSSNETVCRPAIWAILPADAQRALCGMRSIGLDLDFNEDGTPLQSPARSGEALFLCLLFEAKLPVYDSIRCATELVETLTRAEMSAK